MAMSATLVGIFLGMVIMFWTLRSTRRICGEDWIVGTHGLVQIIPLWSLLTLWHWTRTHNISSIRTHSNTQSCNGMSRISLNIPVYHMLSKSPTLDILQLPVSTKSLSNWLGLGNLLTSCKQPSRVWSYLKGSATETWESKCWGEWERCFSDPFSACSDDVGWSKVFHMRRIFSSWHRHKFSQICSLGTAAEIVEFFMCQTTMEEYFDATTSLVMLDFRRSRKTTQASTLTLGPSWTRYFLSGREDDCNFMYQTNWH